jgi:hypothetical protein
LAKRNSMPSRSRWCSFTQQILDLATGNLLFVEVSQDMEVERCFLCHFPSWTMRRTMQPSTVTTVTVLIGQLVWERTNSISASSFGC